METEIATITGSAAVGVLLLMRFAEVIGKLIPDNASGVLGIVRRICKFIGLYVKNAD